MQAAHYLCGVWSPWGGDCGGVVVVGGGGAEGVRVCEHWACGLHTHRVATCTHRGTTPKKCKTHGLHTAALKQSKIV